MYSTTRVWTAGQPVARSFTERHGVALEYTAFYLTYLRLRVFGYSR